MLIFQYLNFFLVSEFFLSLSFFDSRVLCVGVLGWLLNVVLGGWVVFSVFFFNFPVYSYFCSFTVFHFPDFFKIVVFHFSAIFSVFFQFF